MKSSEEEESEGKSSVSNSCVVATGGEEESHDETEDHPDVLVHTEGHDVALRQGGVNVHDGGGEVDHNELQHQHCPGRAAGGG